MDNPGENEKEKVTKEGKDSVLTEVKERKRVEQMPLTVAGLMITTTGMIQTGILLVRLILAKAK